MYGGIDIGSRTVKIVLLKEGKIQDYKIRDSGNDPYQQAIDLIGKYRPKKLVATGYGRHMLKTEFADKVITEIKAHSLGARYLYQNCRTVIDVGGQDSKVISLDREGKFTDFKMNDRCAAGTGRFLEIMALTLGFTIEEFGEKALSATSSVKINSMCTVFSESEVISLISKRVPLLNITLGVHEAIVDRLLSMVHKVNIGSGVVFTGGVANNICVLNLLEERLKQKVLVPKNPEIAGALGAAVEAELIYL
ncbi:MAG: acyl-CoA dehydratase activase [Thermodesulfobacteriota bacterium]|nr:acyl-CoA dehydratase activase [Thermodesulfobacteriota bacterium]